MKKVMQKQLHDPDNNLHGDCWESCILSITELDRKLLPTINDPKYNIKNDWQEFYMDMITALEKNGWSLYNVPVNQFNDNGEYVIASGDSPRGNGVKHAVVWNKGIVHDPHPSNAGIWSIDMFEILEKQHE